LPEARVFELVEARYHATRELSLVFAEPIRMIVI
jgi:hypothetical protein